MDRVMSRMSELRGRCSNGAIVNESSDGSNQILGHDQAVGAMRDELRDQ